MATVGDGMWYEYVNWFHVVQDVVQWQALLRTVMAPKRSQGSDVIPANMFWSVGETYILRPTNLLRVNLFGVRKFPQLLQVHIIVHAYFEVYKTVN
jgi:hypothetical protein